MSERGVFAMDRGWFEHEAFAPEPYTEREAWAWLIAEAAYKERRRRVAGRIIELKRGQLAVSLRFLSEKWNWRKSKVERFLRRLSVLVMIETASETGVNVVTICNYDKYQRVALPIGTPIGTRPRQDRDKVEGKESQELGDGGSGAGEPRRKLISDEAHELAMELAVIAGHDPEFLPPKWVSEGPAYRVQMMLDGGWRRDVMLDNARAAMRKKRDGPPLTIKYFEPIFARAHAPPLPLPSAQLVKNGGLSEQATAYRATQQGWQQRRDDRHAARAEFRAAVDAAANRGGEGDGPPLRVVQDAG